MYVLKSPEGNVVRKTDSGKRREELLRQGYVEERTPEDPSTALRMTGGQGDQDDGIQGATPYVPKKRRGMRTPGDPSTTLRMTGENGKAVAE